ncbi:xanthine dehydrogenase family protein molybdopterin-binding subunit [Mesorhizobium wenxiniae]|uniref:Twin-arginine translocation pathway signal protein n=1 Tax=Mesorhizobium wenxiniae TaxID=2014805 RepID=A0A271KAR6_9HYPH|nr:xanthine dehydrogenase family protein molybdopterin-binding subunit [Mesorhizobium wenxiniae]PAP92079.1 twin-arginine translocation pathway signal protein [Mesorhizobium wenxiniae]
MGRRQTYPTKELSRRSFLVLSAVAGGGLVLGLPNLNASADETSAQTPFEAYLRIAPDSSVTVLSAHVEMGQGIFSGIAALVAEELDADITQMHAVGASGNTRLYNNITMGGTMQETQGSSAMSSSFERYRRAGATARAMLVTAAARTWNVAEEEITVDAGVIAHPSGKSASFGELVEAAVRQPVPSDVKLKDPKDWRYIGSEKLRRLDAKAKSSGRQDYTIDIKLPDMLTAVVAHPPLFGAAVKSFDAAAAKRVKGVVDVVEISHGVAVLGQNMWAAIKGREALVVEWNNDKAEKRGSARLLQEYRDLAARPADALAVSRGDADLAMADAATTLEATYEFPFLAHAPMEPLNAIAHRLGDRLDLWGGFQMPDHYQKIAAKTADLPQDAVKLHVTMAGGAFGRRGTPDAQIVVEAIECAKAIGWRVPVKVQWTREDDITAGRYRPMCVHVLKAGLTQEGKVSAWKHRIVGQSILAGTQYEQYVQGGVDPSLTEGAADTPYGIPHFAVEVSNAKVGVPTLWWRAVGHSHNAYVMETMIDELAAAAGSDPIEFRIGLLAERPRHIQVLNLVAEKANWGKTLSAGRFRGVAVHETYGSVVAQVAEIVVDGDGGFRVDRVVCAIDCGLAVAPDQIRAQMEGGIGFGLGATLHSKITLSDGAVDQTNFDTYEVLRLSGMPKVEVHIVPLTSPSTGAGEASVPPIGPAVANALAAATGRRSRVLPLQPLS